MTISIHPSLKRGLFRLALACCCLGLVNRLGAYIDLAPTLSKIIGDSQKISLVEVSGFNQTTHVLTLKEVRVLKGVSNQAPVLHNVGCLLYTSPSPRDGLLSRMPSSA